MRSTVRLTLVLALLALTAPVMAAPSVPTAGFQLQADGLLHVPSGGEVASTGFPLSTMIGKGPGFALTATMGLRPHLAIGARVAHFGSTGEREAWFVDPLSPYGLGPFHEERRLRVTMLHAILQHRAFYGRRFEWSLDLGGGIMMSRERLGARFRDGHEGQPRRRAARPVVHVRHRARLVGRGQHGSRRERPLERQLHHGWRGVVEG
jgi:hypothetical protein